MSGKKFLWYDPRVAAIRYPGWFVVGYLVIFVLFGTYGNYRVLDLCGRIALEKAEYEMPSSRGLTFLLQKFIEFVPCHWASQKVVANKTVFTFDT